MLVSTCLTIASIPAAALGQAAGALISRDELNAAAARAEQHGDRLQAAALRQRLQEGDFQVGDRIVLTFVSDALHSDTLLVRAGRVIDVPATSTVLPLTGVLRSELKDRVSAEILKYVKAQRIDVAPLTRIAVFGEVTHPGYFAFRSDVPITDAIMLAGGPTAAADIEQTVVKRGSREYRSVVQMRQAVSQGLTLDQLGLSGGDELVVGRRRQPISGSFSTVMGLSASLAAIIYAIRR